jgi:hypothetical protein
MYVINTRGIKTLSLKGIHPEIHVWKELEGRDNPRRVSVGGKSSRYKISILPK